MTRQLHPRRRSSFRAGFTLVELLVSMAILAIIMLLVTQMVGDTSKVWTKTSGKIDAFRQARLGFEEMTTELAQATTNTYWDYFNATGQTVAQWNAAGNTGPFVPVAYGRQSELHFVSGNAAATGLANGAGVSRIYGAGNNKSYVHGVFFACPLGNAAYSQNAVLNSLLTASGFYIEFASDFYGSPVQNFYSNGPPTSLVPTLTTKYRFRLIQFLQPTETLHVYDYSLTSGTNFFDWYINGLNTITPYNSHQYNCRITANNIIALVVWPRKLNTIDDRDPNITNDSALAPYYSFDSRQGLASGVATTSTSSIQNTRTASTTPTAATPYSTWTPGPDPVTGVQSLQPLQMNQMPPLVTVAMVALDETSASILQGGSSTAPTAITTALNGLFTNAGPPATAPSYSSPDPAYDPTLSYMDNDLAVLQSRLARISPKLNFQTYETTIAIRGAKFSNP